MAQEDIKSKWLSASELMNSLFDVTLMAPEFDPDVVALVKLHLGCGSPQSKAGSNLANALLALASQRANRGQT